MPIFSKNPMWPSVPVSLSFAVIDEMLTGCSSTLFEVSVGRDTAVLGRYPRKVKTVVWIILDGEIETDETE